METAKETLKIHTPEHVGFRYVLAGLGTRSSAFLLDTIVRGLFILFIFLAVSLLARWLPAFDPTGILAAIPKSWFFALGVLAYGVVDLGYFLIFEALWSGQTPGKRMQNLRVIRVNGQPIGWLESSIRNILRAVDILLGFYPLGLFVMFLSSRSQRIGDYAAGTVVIVERRRNVPMDRTRLRTTSKLNLPELDVHLSTLEPKQYQVIRSFLQRRQVMNRAHRSELARLLARRLMKRWGISPSADISDETFLEEVVGIYERSRRAI
ncbi:MAG: RDD family protein [Deltaproteobacteria bacterium]|nr:RDD family protein [Deltaproteobacteria bacterium]